MEEVYKIDSTNPLATTHSLLVDFNNKVIITAIKQNAEFIETNGNLASYLQESSRFVFLMNFGDDPYETNVIKGRKIDPISDPYGEEDWDEVSDDKPVHKVGKYKLGYIGNKKIIVDPYLRWTENVIYFKNDKQETLYSLIIEDPEKILAI
jgi:hypothetical protein